MSYHDHNAEDRIEALMAELAAERLVEKISADEVTVLHQLIAGE